MFIHLTNRIYADNPLLKPKPVLNWRSREIDAALGEQINLREFHFS